MRQSFTVGPDALAVLDGAKPLERFDDARALMGVLRSLVGKRWPTWADFEGTLSAALRDAGAKGELTSPLWRLIRKAVAVSDPEGEVQKGTADRTLPDLALRDQQRLPLHEDVNQFIQRDIKPDFPYAWLENDTVKIGYSIRLPPSRQAICSGDCARGSGLVTGRPIRSASPGRGSGASAGRPSSSWSTSSPRRAPAGTSCAPRPPNAGAGARTRSSLGSQPLPGRARARAGLMGWCRSR